MSPPVPARTSWLCEFERPPAVILEFPADSSGPPLLAGWRVALYDAAAGRQMFSVEEFTLTVSAEGRAQVECLHLMGPDGEPAEPDGSGRPTAIAVEDGHVVH